MKTKVFCFFFKPQKTKRRGEKIISGGNNCKSSQSAKFQLTAFVTSSVLNTATSLPTGASLHFFVFSLLTVGARAHPTVNNHENKTRRVTELRLHVNLPEQMCATPTEALLGSAHTKQKNKNMDNMWRPINTDCVRRN